MHRTQIGLALGGGGARGFAHIGVLQALEQADIEIRCLSGTSMGAVIAAGYAHKKDLKRLEKHVLDFAYLDFIKYHNRNISIDIHKLIAYFDDYLENSDFSELQIPLQILTADLKEMRGFVINQGKVSRAIAAACTAPYIQKPIQYGNRLLVDGGVLSDVPIELVDNPIIDMIIGVKVASKHPRDERDDFSMNKLQKLMISKFPLLSFLWHKQISAYMRHSKRIVHNELAQLRIAMVKKPLVLIEPELGDMSTFSFDQADKAIEAGYIATIKALPTLRSADYSNRANQEVLRSSF